MIHYSQEDEETGEFQLFAAKRRKSRQKADLPLFGDLVVYDSEDQATESLDEDDKTLQCVRLVQVANTRQLRGMLDKATEICRPTSALYLRVSKLCPMYWAKWRSDQEHADLDVVSDVPQSGSRDAFLSKMKVENGGGVRVRVARNRDAGSKRELFLSPRGRVVGAPCFGQAERVPLGQESDEEGDSSTGGD